MKITVNIDCTPVEAREFMGLPDVRPMQASLMEDVEKRMRASLDQLSPQSLLQTWLASSPSIVQDSIKHMLDLTKAAKAPSK